MDTPTACADKTDRRAYPKGARRLTTNPKPTGFKPTTRAIRPNLGRGGGATARATFTEKPTERCRVWLTEQKAKTTTTVTPSATKDPPNPEPKPRCATEPTTKLRPKVRRTTPLSRTRYPAPLRYATAIPVSPIPAPSKKSTAYERTSHQSRTDLPTK